VQGHLGRPHRHIGWGRFQGDLDDVNLFWYFHIRSPASGRIWTGPFRGWVRVPGLFNDCEGAISSAQESAGFRELDIGEAENAVVNVRV
jgi:hypothetical protein